MWVLPPSLSPSEAVMALQRDIPHLGHYLQTGQLELIPCYEWYLSNGTIEIDRLLAAWQSKVDPGGRAICGTPGDR